jgi:hypothetical protein
VRPRRKGARNRENCGPPPFVDVTALRVGFRHVNGMSGDFYYRRSSARVTLFDFNNDGRLDMLVLQGEPLAPGKAAAGAIPRASIATT